MRSLPLIVRHALLGFFALSAPSAAFSQLEFPAASPLTTLQQRVGLTDIELTYSRPSMKEREVFGELVPYGEVWRTGANAPTKMTFSTPVVLEGTEVPAGTYALFTIPGEHEWTIILSGQTDLWGAMGYDPAQDVARFEVPVLVLEQPVETFTIGFDALRDESALLYLDWATTRAAIDLEVEYVDDLAKDIAEFMASEAERKPYLQAARFYMDHGFDTEKALDWVQSALEQNPNAYWARYLEAQVLAKLGRTSEALEAARASMAGAAEQGNPDYVKLNEDLIASLE